MAYYSEEDLMEHLYGDGDGDEENSYVSYLLRQKRKRKEKLLQTMLIVMNIHATLTTTFLMMTGK